MANQSVNAADTEKAKDSFSAIRAALTEALEHPLSHGSYTLELTYRDSRIDRFITSWRQSHLLACSGGHEQSK